ncbi:F-box protein SKIP14 [Linum grandiflorum]
MALNCSHRVAEDNLASRPMMMAGGCFGDRCESQQEEDILKLLPSDPFGMDITTTVTAIRGWLEDYFIWSNEFTMQQPADLTRYDAANSSFCYGCRSVEKTEMEMKMEMESFGCGSAFGLPPGKEGSSSLAAAGEMSIVAECCYYDADGDEAKAFHPGLDFLSVEMVCCGSLHSAAVRDDLSLWRSICFEQLGGHGYDSMNKKTEKDPGEYKEVPGLMLPDDLLSGNDLYSAVDEMSIGDCCNADQDGGNVFHSVLDFALGYLDLSELLAVGMVCTSLHSAVRDDPSLWRSIYVHKPLNEKITDDVLVQLTDRARGNLEQLTLVECQWITDAGLKHVLVNNPKLTKLGVAGCSRVNINNIVTTLKEFKVSGKIALKHLRIGGIYCVTHEHYEVLKSVVADGDATTVEERKSRVPCYYSRETQYTVCDDDRALDIETCPKCRNHKLVYDCPVESCQQWKKHSAQACRACILCIRRCAECGCCINNREYVETFLLEYLCAACGSGS